MSIVLEYIIGFKKLREVPDTHRISLETKTQCSQKLSTDIQEKLFNTQQYILPLWKNQNCEFHQIGNANKT